MSDLDREYLNLLNNPVPEKEKPDFQQSGIGYTPQITNPNEIGIGPTLSAGTNSAGETVSGVGVAAKAEQASLSSSVQHLNGNGVEGTKTSAELAVDIPGLEGLSLVAAGAEEQAKYSDGGTYNSTTGEFGICDTGANILKMFPGSAIVGQALEQANKIDGVETKFCITGSITEEAMTSVNQAKITLSNSYDGALTGKVAVETWLASASVEAKGSVGYGDNAEITAINENSAIITEGSEFDATMSEQTSASAGGFTFGSSSEASVKKDVGQLHIFCDKIGDEVTNRVQDTPQSEKCKEYDSEILTVTSYFDSSNPAQLSSKIIGYNHEGQAEGEFAGYVTREDLTTLIEQRNQQLDMMDGVDNDKIEAINGLEVATAQDMQMDYSRGADMIKQLETSEIAADDKIMMPSLYVHLTHLDQKDQEGITSHDMQVDVTNAIANPQQYTNITYKQYQENQPKFTVTGEDEQIFNSTVTTVLVTKDPVIENEPIPEEQSYDLGAR